MTQQPLHHRLIVARTRMDADGLRAGGASGVELSSALEGLGKQKEVDRAGIELGCLLIIADCFWQIAGSLFRQSKSPIRGCI